MAQRRLLNHVEMVYRPGERQLVEKVFRVLGCKVVDSGGTYLSIQVDSDSDDAGNNVFYASEVTGEQWRFEQLLQQGLRGEGDLAAGYRGYDELLERTPQRATHFGIRLGSPQELDGTVERVQALNDPELAGRLKVSAVFRPGEYGSLTDKLVQAFIKTDVCAAGLVSLGQHIELQAAVS